MGKNDNVVITAKLTYGNARPIGGIVYVNIGSKSYRIVVIEGTGSLNIGKMDVGVYEFRATYGGSEEYGKSESDGSFKVLDTLLNVVLTSNNVTKYYGGKDKLVITLETPSGRAISGATLHVTINKNKKDYVTDSNGQVLVDLNYGVGTYAVKVEFDETKSYHAASTSSVVNVLSTVEASDLVKLAGSGSQYFAIFHDSNGKALANTNVKFSIAGKTYTFKTLPNGIARININLAPGKYVITAINPVTGQQVKNNIKIYNKIMENNDLTMFYTSGKYYKVRAFGSDGNPVGAAKL